MQPCSGRGGAPACVWPPLAECGSLPARGERHACIASRLAFNGSEQLGPLDPWEDEPWIRGLLALYSGGQEAPGRPEAASGLAGDRLRVAVARAFPYDPGGLPEGSPLRCRPRVPFEELSPGLLGLFLGMRGCSANALGRCMADFLAYPFAALRADLLNWPQHPTNSSGEVLQLLWEYDLVIFHVIERRYLPSLPEIPGQLRLMLGSEAYAYGDTSDKRYREFNTFTPTRLKAQGFCRVPLDPFLGGSYRWGPVVPFWMHYPVGDMLQSLPLEAAARAASSRRILMRIGRWTFAVPLARALRRLGWELDFTERVPTIPELLDLMASCRFIIYLPFRAGQGRSMGRLIMQASLLGIPIFAPRHFLFARLLMPPTLSFATSAEIVSKVKFLQRTPDAEERLRASIARRRALVDLRGAPSAADIAAAARFGAGDDDELCRLDPAARRARRAAGARLVGGSITSVGDYYRDWIMESLIAFHRGPLARLSFAELIKVWLIDCALAPGVGSAEQAVAYLGGGLFKRFEVDERSFMALGGLSACVLTVAEALALDPPLQRAYADPGRRAILELAQTGGGLPSDFLHVDTRLEALSAAVIGKGLGSSGGVAKRNAYQCPA